MPGGPPPFPRVGPGAPGAVVVELLGDVADVEAVEFAAELSVGAGACSVVGAELDRGASVVGSGTPLPVSPWMSALSGSFSLGVPLRTVFMNSCQIAPGR